ncbi:hypothetical protein DFP73DRAFT_391346 [Morchella snyderi]|nr:hypothetical protein DFP73DRAFT_391346 [Morchella snyderi]
MYRGFFFLCLFLFSISQRWRYIQAVYNRTNQKMTVPKGCWCCLPWDSEYRITVANGCDTKARYEEPLEWHVAFDLQDRRLSPAADLERTFPTRIHLYQLIIGLMSKAHLRCHLAALIPLAYQFHISEISC